jgi:signal transduction histidine kinase
VECAYNNEMVEKVLFAGRIIEEQNNEIKQLKESKINMEGAMKAQEEFIVNISHDLKTPLNVIFSTIQLFEMYCRDGSLVKKKGKIINYIESMKLNSYRLSKLINNIVDSSKINAGFFELKMSNNNIVEVIEDTVMSVINYADSKWLNIIFDTDIEEKIIACDPEKIERVVLNLISNAIKFSDKGKEIFVNIKLRDEFLEISVKDCGIGLKVNQLNMIFDRFKQVDESLSRNAEGTGIGLSLAKSIVELHGGRMFVESEFGNGSKFIFTIPTTKVMQENLILTSKIRNKSENINVELSDITL